MYFNMPEGGMKPDMRISNLIFIGILSVMCVFGRAFSAFSYIEKPMEANSDSRRGISMTLDDCLRMALSQNPDMAIERIDADNANRNIFAEKAAFDPTFSTSFTYADSRRPTSSIVTGNRRTTTELRSGYSEKIENGDAYNISLIQTKADTDSRFSSLNPSYTLDLSLNYTRPLKQGRGRNIALLKLRITKLNSKISDLEFKSEVMNLAADVESAYWSLVYAEENLRVRLDSLELAEKTLKKTRDLIDVGALAESQGLLVEAQAASRQENVIAARGGVSKAVLQLKLVMHVTPDSDLWELPIEPGGPLSITPQFTMLDFEQGLETAMAKRPDYLGALIGQEVSSMQTMAARDRTRPSMDLQTTVGLGGLQDGYFGSLQDISSLQYPSWQVGIWMDVPVRRREAKVRLEQSLADEQIAGLEIEKIRQRIAVELADTQVSIRTAEEKMAAAQVSTRYALSKLHEEEEKLSLGVATTHDVLEYQNDLAAAKLNESAAIIDYNMAVADYYYVLGTLLEEKGIEIQGDGFNIAH